MTGIRCFTKDLTALFQQKDENMISGTATPIGLIPRT